MQLKLLYQNLDEFRHVDENNIEFWYARDLWGVFGYSSWRNFKEGAIERAKESCRASDQNAEDHFVDVRKMIEIGKGGQRETDDIILTRYACYLIAQNGDPKIPEIAFMQRYFAVQTRKQEVLEQNIEELERIISRKKLGETEKELTKTVFERNVDGVGLSQIRNAGDKALFNGYSTREMKERLGVLDAKTPLADVLPSITLKAKDLATEMTILNTKKKDLSGKDSIKLEHTMNNMGIRKALTNQDIYPERLPPAEDIKQVEKRHKEAAAELQPKTKKLLD